MIATSTQEVRRTRHSLFDEEKATPRLEVAAYIAQMSSELGTMAKGAEITLLSHFLEMAASEAHGSSTNLARMTGLPQPLAQQADQART
jgi:hypothetical protein